MSWLLSLLNPLSGLTTPLLCIAGAGALLWVAVMARDLETGAAAKEALSETRAALDASQRNAKHAQAASEAECGAQVAALQSELARANAAPAASPLPAPDPELPACDPDSSVSW